MKVKPDHVERGERRERIVASLMSVAYDYADRKLPIINVPPPGDLDANVAKDCDAEALCIYASDTDTNSATLKAVRQYYAILAKNSYVKNCPTAEIRATECYNKFRGMQKHNRIATKRLNYYLWRPSRMPPLLGNLLGRAQLDLFHLLGCEPNIEDWNSFFCAKVFSGGVSQGLKSIRHGSRSYKDTSAYGKLSETSTITSTRDCLETFARYLCNGEYGKHILSGKQSGKLVTSSRGTTVPKDAVVDRFIAIEPLLNAQAQQGILAMLEYYLRRWGITLHDQRRNTELAKTASTLGCNISGWSTIDLSSASDTITDPLVKYLLPRNWYNLLNAARTKSVAIEGKEVEGYSSFCTMGNAFTFPLQCLIFTALTRAAISLASPGNCEYRVYGDDIIVPSSASLILLEALKFCGFIPNVRKSFIVGFFRESCGGEFLHGDDVAPVMLKEDILKLTTKHVFFNRLQRVDPWHPALDVLYDSVKTPLIGPALSSSECVGSYFEAPPFVKTPRIRRWYSKKLHTIVWRVPGLVPRSIKVNRRDQPRALLASLSGSPGERHDLRGSQRYHVTDILVTVYHRLRDYATLWYAM